MKAIITIDYTHLKALYSLQGILYDELIKQEKIDSIYYDVIINKMARYHSSDSLSYKFYVEYTLKRNPIWDTLEEVEERLKIGL